MDFLTLNPPGWLNLAASESPSISAAARLAAWRCRTWGWSPVEEMILLALNRTPGTVEDIATSLGVPIQVAGSTVARLMEFGLVEVRFSPAP
jgi:DNA-binding MarR family transcriptional regulator